MSSEPRTLRAYFHTRLAELKAESPGVEFAGIVGQDGQLAATDASSQPEGVDRRAGLAVSLAATAAATAREFGRDGLRSLRLTSNDGAIILRSFGRPSKRLLLIILNASADAQRVATAAQKLTVEIEDRMRPATRIG